MTQTLLPNFPLWDVVRILPQPRCPECDARHAANKQSVVAGGARQFI
ncbi:hypothetical protein BL470_005330 [Escherichia coli]|nr:hypothetical protein [Escherichia coli]EFG6100980.1 hypothetical protein [Escherichia coli]EFG8200254.1 hypothetical protein [Escherichia coli]EFG9941237.1 hypothetical protein [Escherichia coli]